MTYLHVKTVTVIEDKERGEYIPVSGTHYNYFHNDGELSKFLDKFQNEVVVEKRKVKVRSRRTQL